MQHDQQHTSNPGKQAEERYDIAAMRRKLRKQHFFVRIHPIVMGMRPKKKKVSKSKISATNIEKNTSVFINIKSKAPFMSSAYPDAHVEYETQERVKKNVVIEQVHNLIVWNDEVNTFDWVISSLMEVCDHTTDQAEQCAIIIHHQGKYAVRKGGFDTLRPMCEALIDRGIQATIDY
ncbi:MAG: ATP-dependent Clp protease adaptor ClpS [Bacteroidota bacterium]